MEDRGTNIHYNSSSIDSLLGERDKVHLTAAFQNLSQNSHGGIIKGVKKLSREGSTRREQRMPQAIGEITLQANKIQISEKERSGVMTA